MIAGSTVLRPNLYAEDSWLDFLGNNFSNFFSDICVVYSTASVPLGWPHIDHGVKLDKVTALHFRIEVDSPKTVLF